MVTKFRSHVGRCPTIVHHEVVGYTEVLGSLDSIAVARERPNETDEVNTCAARVS